MRCPVWRAAVRNMVWLAVLVLGKCLAWFRRRYSAVEGERVWEGGDASNHSRLPFLLGFLNLFNIG